MEICLLLVQDLCYSNASSADTRRSVVFRFIDCKSLSLFRVIQLLSNSSYEAVTDEVNYKYIGIYV
jgi:hypothetical protein